MKIIKDVSVFDINFIPPKKLPVRQELVNEISENIKHSNNYKVFLTGKTGGGKTVVALKVIDFLKDLIIPIYINCSEINTYNYIGKTFLDKVKGAVYDVRGRTRDEISQWISKSLETKRKKKILLVIDEVDKLIVKKENHIEILFTLLNHGAINFILISNEPNILEKIDPRIKKRFGDNEIILDVYSAGEIFKILKPRAELGLKKSSWDVNLLGEISRFSSSISGDVRHSIQLLEKSAVKAEVRKAMFISLDDVEEAVRDIQVSDIEKIYPKLQEHLKLVVIALIQNALKTREGYAVTYPNSYFSYEKLAKNRRFGAVGERQFREYLRDLEMLNLFTLQWKTPINRRGRLRIAIPNFDFKLFWERINGNNGDGVEGGGVGSTSVISAKDEAERFFSEART